MQKVKYNGKEYRSVTVACDLLGIGAMSVWRYTKKGLSVEQAIEQILANKKRNNCVDHLGCSFKSIRAMAGFYHIPYNTLYWRLKCKWPLRMALTKPLIKKKEQANG